MNLQICFMNETASDSESPGSDTEVKSSQPPASLPCQLVNKVKVTELSLYDYDYDYYSINKFHAFI